MKNKYIAFLSHNSQDKPNVEQIAQWLEDKANLSVWLDKWNLIPGDPWQEEIEKALDESQCCVVFLGPKGIGPWQNEEMRTAIEERVSKQTIRVVPVLLPGAVRPGQESKLPRFLRRLTWVVFQQNWDEEDALHRLLCGIKGIPPGRDEKKTKADICPYRGLEVFREQDQNFFFGREAVVQRLMDKLNTSRFLAVLGPSGCGKSSVVQAGLIPHLREKALVTLFTPREQPIEELAFALRKCYQENKIPPVEQLIERLKGPAKNLHYIAREVLEDTDKENLVVVIDQFEELFTQTQAEEERRKFIMAMLTAVEAARRPVIVILTIRSDFMGKCAFYPDLNTYVSDHFFQVEPMNPEELRSAIEEPAQLAGLDFETGLVNRILEDIKGAPGELPLLEHALLELYERRKGTQIPLQAYEEIGGIEGALVKRAEMEFAKLDDGQKEILRKIFVLRLIQPGEGTEDTRRRAEKEELLAVGEKSRIAEDLLIQWTNARLLTITHDTLHNKDFVDVAHEALIRKWDRIQTWMTEDREVTRQINILRNASKEWKRVGENPDFLFQGARLVQMEYLLKSHVKDLTITEIEFVKAGIGLREKKEKEKEEARIKELQKELRQKRFINRVIIIAGIVSILLALIAFVQKHRADKQYKEAVVQKNRAVINRLVAESGFILQKDNIKAIRIAEAAYKISKKSILHPPSSVMQALSASAYSMLERPFYIASMTHKYAVNTAVFSPDGTKILTTSDDQTAKLWDLSGKLIAVFNKHKSPVMSAVFSPDGTKILTTAKFKTAKLWNLRGKLLVDLNQHMGKVISAVFSPDGTKILTASEDKTAKLWDLEGKLLVDFNQDTGKVVSAVFSPDGTKILTASEDKTAKLWDLEGKLLVDFNQHTGKVVSAVFSPDGTKILTASEDKTAKLWDLEGKLLVDFNQHTGIVKSAIFSPEGTKIVTVSDENTVKLWDLRGNLLADFKESMFGVNSAVFSPDGSKILTASGHKTAKLWDLRGKLLVVFNHHILGVKSALFSPDGTKILTASLDYTAKLWDLRGNRLIDLNKHTSDVKSAIFSPDGNKIVTISKDHTAKLWDLKGNVLADLNKHKDEVNSGVFSPDSAKIVTISKDHTAKLWDLKGNVLADMNKHKDEVNRAVFSPDGTKIVTTSKDHTAKLWDLEGNVLADLNKHTGQVWDAVFSSDGTKILTTSEDHTAKLWDLKGNVLADLNKHKDDVYDGIFSPDGTKILTSSGDKTAKLWDLKGNILADLNKNTGYISIIMFSPDGTRILTACGNTVEIWDLSGKLLTPLYYYLFGVNSAIFNPDGTKILIAGDTAAKLCDLGGKLLADLNRHTEFVISASFSPDGSKILTTSVDNTAKLWDLRGNLLADLNKHTSTISSAMFSPDGTRILTASADGTAKIWYTPEAIIEWLKTAPIPKLSKEDKEELGIADFEID
jgi:WD40 repeat protein/energy-coupling factor transporter ATP-binding protein EcfA2